MFLRQHLLQDIAAILELFTISALFTFLHFKVLLGGIGGSTGVPSPLLAFW